MTARNILIVSSIYLVLALAILLAVPTCSVQAGEYVHPIYEHGGYQQPRRARRVRRHVRREPRYDRETVRLYRRADENFVCGPPVRGLGTQWIGEEGALDAAKKDFMERVRYDLGESYLDLKNAQDFVSRCGRVSVGEVAGQVMYRCELIATPCKPKFVEGQQVKR
jgi:hypothetical protein